MRLLSNALAALCLVLSISSLWLYLFQKKSDTQSLYWVPLSEARLEARLRSELNSLPDIKIALAEPLAKRNPRNSVARASLADAYLQKGNLAEFEAHYYSLFSISRSKAGPLRELLVNMSSDQRVFDAVIAYIKNNKPNWGGFT